MVVEPELYYTSYAHLHRTRLFKVRSGSLLIMSSLPTNEFIDGYGSGQPPTVLESRKQSLSVIFPRPSLSGYAAGVETARVAHATGNRRRLSQVTRRLSKTIGWRTAVSQEEVISQAENLCVRFLRYKLRSFGSVHKKLKLNQLKSLSQIGGDPIMAEVCVQLRQLTQLLERQNPRLFQSVICSVGLKSLPNEMATINLFQAVADEIIRSEISWGRIVALYSVAGTLALDCIRLGRPEFVLGLIRGIGTVIEGDGAAWLVQQGGRQF
ncbi:bcl-2-related ovarian killer protein homolog B-like isoform X2 [Limulus polyphemus]|uniref:Bcl-2-related ovarian killer protein homolog B-like isoform X2 n=1 Tax=Limulus polyphemus TaxID=6850 RepID=A0ABM1T703_LIMPO|nr:bcl-2-related ovarian killer protein homolog B-like isoform X2 [Limulus polyphemus]